MYNTMSLNVLLIILTCVALVKCSSFGDVEIAHGKPAVISSFYSNSYPASNINDGNKASFAHTGGELTPYVRIDLQDVFSIQRVEISLRNCCPERELGAVIRIGLSDDVTSNTQCGEPITSDETSVQFFAVRECDRSVFARYVSISRETGVNYVLNPTELEVFGGQTMEYDDHCYRTFSTAETWSDAKSACENQNSNLLTINTEEERTYVTGLMTTFNIQTYMWTGLNDITVEGNPEWLTYNPTIHDYDQDEENDCFAISTGASSLHQESCNLEYGYICEARTNIYKKYELDAEFKTPTTAHVVKSMLAVSPGACSLECDNVDGCISFSFDFMSNECQLSTSTGLDGELVDAGSAYFYKSTSSNLVCSFL